MVATAFTQLLTVKDLRCLSSQHVTFVVVVTSYMYPHAGTAWWQFIVSGSSCVHVSVVTDNTNIVVVCIEYVGDK